VALHLVLILAVLQGVAEFLPISSSGHLRLLEAVFGIEDTQTLFDVLLHIGTLFAVLWVYRALVGRLLGATLRALARPARLGASYREDEDFRVMVLVCLGMVPTGIIAVTAGAWFERWAHAVAFVGVALLVNAAILVVLGGVLKRRRPDEGLTLAELDWKRALLIGTVQGFAVIRGLSRSGSTITAGVLGGLRQDAAAAYSFLLSIPAILGALVLSLADYQGDCEEILVPGVVGALVAAVVGVLALKLLLSLLQRGRLGIFAAWCAIVGVVAIVWDVVVR
jgi:undecaprenyl-diphosphatase